MKPHLLSLMYRIHVLVTFLEALYEALGQDETARETARLAGAIDQHPEEINQRVDRTCPAVETY